MLSMHELSLSMPEPMLSLSMLILATHPEAALDLDAAPRVPRTASYEDPRVPWSASYAVPLVSRTSTA